MDAQFLVRGEPSARPLPYLRAGSRAAQSTGSHRKSLEIEGTRLYGSGVSKDIESLDRRIEALRAEIRRAAASGDRERARGLRAELLAAERRWDYAIEGLADDAGEAGADEPAPGRPGFLPAAPLPVRDQVHEALTLLGVPAAPRLIVSVRDAFYADGLSGARLTSLRRDEERSFRSAPFSRPYYLCAALTADLLAPVRGLLAISTWPMASRIIGPLSPRADFLTAAAAVAQRLKDVANPSQGARRLLWRFAMNIPHAGLSFATMTPEEVLTAARTELAVHADADAEQRAAAARRARTQLGDAEQLFGSGLRISRPGATA